MTVVVEDVDEEFERFAGFVDVYAFCDEGS